MKREAATECLPSHTLLTDHSLSLDKCVCRCVYPCVLAVRDPQEINIPVGLWKGYALESFINSHCVCVGLCVYGSMCVRSSLSMATGLF